MQFLTNKYFKITSRATTNFERQNRAFQAASICSIASCLYFCSWTPPATWMQLLFKVCSHHWALLRSECNSVQQAHQASNGTVCPAPQPKELAFEKKFLTQAASFDFEKTWSTWNGKRTSSDFKGKVRRPLGEKLGFSQSLSSLLSLMIRLCALQGRHWTSF